MKLMIWNNDTAYGVPRIHVNILIDHKNKNKVYLFEVHNIDSDIER